jgi:hypothetical protein
VQRRAIPPAASLVQPRRTPNPAAVALVQRFINRWQKGDIAAISQILTEDCLILEPLWAVPGSKPILSGIQEVSWFRQYYIRAKDHTSFDILNVASTAGTDEDRVFLQFRETNTRTPLVWEVIKTAIKTSLLFPLYQSDEAGVMMFKLRKDGRIKEIVCLRKPPELEDTTGKILQDDYTPTTRESSPQFLTLFDRM